MSTSPRSAVWRGDVLRLLHALGDEQGEYAAAIAGFIRPVIEPLPVLQSIVTTHAPISDPLKAACVPPSQQFPPLRARHYAITLSQTSEAPATEVPGLQRPPVDDAPDLSHVLSIPSSSQTPPRTPLTKPVRLGAFLRQHLRHLRSTQELDATRWVAELARGSLPRMLPRRQRLAWGRSSGVFVQGGRGLTPLSTDVHALLARLRHEAGDAVHLAWWVEGAGWYLWQGGQWRAVTARQLPVVKRALLVNVEPDASAALLHAWKPLHALCRQPNAVLALRPCVTSGTAQAWSKGLQWVAWEHGSNLIKRSNLPLCRSFADGVERLLACLTLAVRVEPELLRAVRLLLDLPTQAEIVVWEHPSVQSCSLGFQIISAHLSEYKLHLIKIPLLLRQKVAELIFLYHRNESPLIQLEEMALASELAGVPKRDRDGLCWEHLAQELRERPKSELGQAISRYVHRLEKRVDSGIWQVAPGLARTWVLARQDDLRTGIISIPEGLPGAWVAQELGRRRVPIAQSVWWLVVRDSGVWLQSVEPVRPYLDILSLDEVSGSDGVLIGVGGESPRWISLSGGRVCVFEGLPDTDGVLIAIGHRSIFVSEVVRPHWADNFYRNREGLWVDFQCPWGVEHAKYEAGAWVLDEEASSRGLSIDDYGVSWQLDFNGLSQCFRYIAPGCFEVGASLGDDSIVGNESPRHEVFLTDGFWVADAPCTHDFYNMISGGGVAGFYSRYYSFPVSCVSWDDVVGRFLPLFQRILPLNCYCTLPTEAEWEVACRAGSRGMYSWGDEFNSELANVLHTPCGSSFVKKYPPNSWGIYDMHGNVFEWCIDGGRKYCSDFSVNPIGDAKSGAKALRGGSWNHDAWYARASYRFHARKEAALNFSGFRVVLKIGSPNRFV